MCVLCHLKTCVYQEKTKNDIKKYKIFVDWSKYLNNIQIYSCFLMVS